MISIHLQAPVELVVEIKVVAAICPILDEEDGFESFYAMPEQHRRHHFDDWSFSDLRM